MCNLHTTKRGNASIYIASAVVVLWRRAKSNHHNNHYNNNRCVVVARCFCRLLENYVASEKEREVKMKGKLKVFSRTSKHRSFVQTAANFLVSWWCYYACTYLCYIHGTGSTGELSLFLCLPVHIMEELLHKPRATSFNILQTCVDSFLLHSYITLHQHKNW